MKKTLKVTQAICPCCHFRKPLENSDHYFQHILLGCKLPSGETVNWICVGHESEQICVAAGTKTAA